MCSSFPRRQPAKLRWGKRFAAILYQSAGRRGWGREEPQVTRCAVLLSPLIACLPEVPVLGGGDAQVETMLCLPTQVSLPPCLSRSRGEG